MREDAVNSGRAQRHPPEILRELLSRGVIDNSGRRNQNPRGVGLAALLAEDLRTYRGDPLAPGLWVTILHRLGNARMDVRLRPLRAPLSVAYLLCAKAVEWGWGIDLPYTTQLGRRVRIWHHGGIFLGARAIGDDVTIRHGTTMGLMKRGDDPDKKPIIADQVDIGSGVAILGPVVVGSGAVIGANSVVVRDVRPHTTVFGVPARPVDFERLTAFRAQEAAGAQNER